MLWVELILNHYFSHKYQCTDDFLMNLELLNFLFIWKTQPIVHEELASRFPGQETTGAVPTDGLWGGADPNDCLLLEAVTLEKN